MFITLIWYRKEYNVKRKDTDDGREKRCNECSWEFYSTYGLGTCPECGSKDWNFKLRGRK